LPIPRELQQGLQTNRANPRDLLGLCSTLRKIPGLREILKTLTAEMLINLSGQCDSMDEIADLLEAAIDRIALLIFEMEVL